MRLLWIFLALAIFLLIPFLIWGESMKEAFSVQGAVAWLQNYEDWAWAAGLGLLLLDFLLPIPGTAVMSALGYVYGTLLGGIISASGTFLTGLVAYSLCRALGPHAAKKLLGEKDYHTGVGLFSNAGGYIVVLSRWMPLLPEVVACMAGLSRMPVKKFVSAVACGSIPLGFTFVYIGSTGIQSPTLAIIFSAGIPLVLWLIVRQFFKNEIYE